MKQSKNFIISPITILIILIALIFNRFTFIFIHYLIAFIHELSHYMVAKIFRVKVKEIQFLPIGFYLKIDDLELEKLYKQILVLSAGPLSYFISYLVLKIMYKYDIISIYGYEDGKISNLFILLFNLLPIYPLDGERIIEAILTPYLNEYKLRVFRICISIISLVIASTFLVTLGEIVTLVFLYFVTIISIVNFNKEYLFSLIKRLNKKMNNKVRINDKKEIFRLSDNYYLKNGNLMNEEEIIKEIISSKQIIKELKE